MENQHPRQRALLPAGIIAPPFRLKQSLEKEISLEELRGSPVVLIFYPLDWSPVCTDELAIYNEMLGEFDSFRAKVFGISVDSVWCHKAWAESRNLRVPLLSDFHPKAEVSRRYHAYREAEGFSERALYVIDGEGRIFWSHLSPIDVNPGVDGVIDALERLTGRQFEAQSGFSMQPEASP